MSFFTQPCTPFADLTLTSCLSSAPNSCCLSETGDQNASVEMCRETRTVRLSYESGAFALISDDFQLIRSGCRMLWFRDRFGVMHTLD